MDIDATIMQSLQSGVKIPTEKLEAEIKRLQDRQTKFGVETEEGKHSLERLQKRIDDQKN